MDWLKKYWFAGACAVFVIFIGFNLYSVLRVRFADTRATDTIASQGSGTRTEGSNTKQTAVAASLPEDIVSSRAPQEIAFSFKAPETAPDFNTDEVTNALTALDSVGEATVKTNSVKLSMVNSLKLSEVIDGLGVEESALVADEFLLQGGLRLHVSGMT